MSLETIVRRCEDLYEDLDLACVRAWKEQNPDGKAIGFLPTYVPREILHAHGALPVGVLGAGEELEIVQGDACFQSYICHLPRSVVELGLSGRLDALDGMIFPSTCDVIRNLSGVWRLLFPGKYARYLDVPQNFDERIGGAFYAGILRELADDLSTLCVRRASSADLRRSILLYARNRELAGELYDLRAREPWRVPTSEAYLVLRAGMRLPVEEHNRLVEEYLAAAREAPRRERDNARVALRGVFCEQPPLGLIRTLEKAGCYVVDDDFMLVSRWLGSDVDARGDPIESLARAYLRYDGEQPSRYVPDGATKGRALVEAVGRSGAEGVIFASPSFCDPALLDRPMQQAALAAAGIAYTSFKYSENTGQMQPIREQAGTFADTIKLWGEG